MHTKEKGEEASEKEPDEKETENKKTVPRADTARDSDMTIPYEYESFHSGGDSQWRQDAEEEWDSWASWPPVGWRPEPHHRAYWDPNSAYYKYNTYDWDAYNARVSS